MNHIYWVIERELAGRQGPTRAPWDPVKLYRGGIRTVISLAMEVEVCDLTVYKLNHRRAQFPPLLLNSASLQKAFLYEALSIWEFIDAQLAAENPTLVHCYAGNDRTGAILAGYLVTYRGWLPEEAIRKVRDLQPHALEVAGYAEAIQRLEPYLLPDPRTLL
ncbi:MAG: dual specificity protein phosphatase family protein [Anaerolineae bacterium]|nr:dual specificity protein phosphatase family protein [Anaerolineae bacterium]